MRVIRELKTKYEMTGGDDLQWFLGIEVIRDRSQKLIWLSQSSYIEKISKLSDQNHRDYLTPMKAHELMPYTGLATSKEIHIYQRKIGSIMYAAVITRPDVAFAASRLSRFNLYSSPKHHAEADRLISYLYRTQYYDVASGDMIADGLTKALPAAKWPAFMTQLGLVDVKEQLRQRRIKEVTSEDIFSLEDDLKGGR
jgi:hypothetical protein